MKLLAPLLALAAAATLSAANPLVYFGTSTTGDNRGIYLSEFDETTGVLTPARRIVETSNPVFLALHPNHKWLYSLGETPGADGKPTGILQGYAIDPKTGELTLKNRRFTGGPNPCHLTVDATGRSILTTNYNGGYVSVFSLDANGDIAERTSQVQHVGSGPNPDRQTAPHAHGVYMDPTNRFAVVCDLGLDKVLVYHFDQANGILTPNTPPFTTVAPGAGPRHFSFHPNRKFAYVVNEINSSLTAFTWDGENGILKEIQTVPLIPSDFKGVDTSAELAIHKSGKWLYASNRGYDSIRAFSIDTKTGLLTQVADVREGIKHPRHFAIDPSGKWLVCGNRDANTVTVYAIDPKTGALAPTGPSISVPQAICVQFFTR